MLTVEEVEARLTSVQCAICKHNAFAIDRRTLQPDGSWKGICTNCRYTFPIDTDMEFYMRTQPDVPHLLRQIACPACQQQGTDLDFKILMSVRAAFYFLTCRSCKHPFPEKAVYEAFE